MTGMTQIVSGLAVQQQYQATALSSSKTFGERTRNVTRITEDTVDISPRAYELFRSQAQETRSVMASSDTASQETASDRNTTGTEDVAGASRGNTLSDRIAEVESEISTLEADIASLEEAAQTDDIAAALLRSKQARLSTLKAMLTGLDAKSMLQV